MQIIKVRNVCQALPQTISYLNEHGRVEPSRGGEVLVAPTPMMTITEHPRERVLFSAKRNANPFFHLAEAMWMLSGRNDAKFLDRFIHDFSTKYAEEDGTLHDAYGYRWRAGFGADQLSAVVDRLIQDPLDRQSVIQMWDPSIDFNDDLLRKWKSKPCNTNIYLRINENKLDMTVCCRSNDMLWGCHGSNAVHFSILQEYLAARIDVEIGTMYQLSNNAHVYLNQSHIIKKDLEDDRYSNNHIYPISMFTDPEYIDEDTDEFLLNYENDKIIDESDYANGWFANTLGKALHAHKLYKQKQFTAALMVAEEIEAMDWRIACYEWIERKSQSAA